MIRSMIPVFEPDGRRSVVRRRLAAVTMALSVAAVPSLAAGQDGPAFLGSLAGQWAGSGAIRSDEAAPAQATSCRLTGQPSAAGVSIAGSCDGAGRGAQLLVVLRWSHGTGEVIGSFQGGAESGTAALSGRLDGNTLTLKVSSETGAPKQMTVTLAGGQASLKLVGRSKAGQPVELVSLGLRKG